jgi:hypothetical protein
MGDKVPITCVKETGRIFKKPVYNAAVLEFGPDGEVSHIACQNYLGQQRSGNVNIPTVCAVDGQCQYARLKLRER